MSNNRIKTIILTRGLQSSGKTVWSKKWQKEHPANRVRICRNDIKEALGIEWSHENENMIKDIKISSVIAAMKKLKDIVIDEMNLNRSNFDDIRVLVDTHNSMVEEMRERGNLMDEDDYMYKIEFKDFFIPINICIEQDKLRDQPVGEEIIREAYEKYKHIIETGLFNNTQTN